MTDMKKCTKCSVVKDLTDFYPDRRAADGRQSRCRKCMNASQVKKATEPRLIRNRARQRAAADLVKRHEAEFNDLYQLYWDEAIQEARALAATPQAAAHYTSEPVRLKPGARQPGEKAGDRIDVARCPHCVKHHDRGHVCAKCGARPTTLQPPPSARSLAVQRPAGLHTKTA